MTPKGMKCLEKSYNVAASLSRQEFLDKLEEFKEKNFDLLNNKLEG